MAARCKCSKCKIHWEFTKDGVNGYDTRSPLRTMNCPVCGNRVSATLWNEGKLERRRVDPIKVFGVD